MARVPVAGRVKTRLARDVGTSEAIRFYRSAASALIARLAGLPFFETWITVTPDADASSRQFPLHVRRMGQGGGDLGRRMQSPMRQLPPGPVCVIGTDIPGIEVAHLRRAFRELGRRSIVFGPAEDGGFWLVGQRRRPRLLEPYAGVRWSQPDTLQRILASLNPRDVAFTDRRADVDTRDDLVRDQALIGRRTRARA